jgi:hypothetical protein
VLRLHGRAAALARARLRLQQACAGEGGLLLITGEPGIGKSSLAEHLSVEAAQAGAAVAWGRCWEAGGAPPYWPWIQLFRELHMEGDPFASAAVQPGEDAEQARFRTFDLTVRRLKEAAAQRPLVLMMDDLHAGDIPSLLLLLLLSRQLRTTRILLVGTYRDAELRLAPAAAALLVKVAREGEVLPLGRLDAGACGDWIREAWPEASAAETAQLHRLTEGHPLFLVEALRLGLGAEAQQRMLEGLGAVLDERLAHLAPATHAVLQVAAVLGREFSASDLAATAQGTLDDAHRALREASGASIVQATGAQPAPERFRFSHVLLRDRLYAELTPSTRATLHWRAGTVQLERAEGAAAAVHHLFEGASAGEPRRLAEVALAAAEAALGRLAFEEAARLAERALHAGGRALPEPLICQLMLVAGEAAIRLGQSAQGKRLCEQAAALAEPLGASELLVRAALVYGTDLHSGSVDPIMVKLLRQALAQLPPGDSPLRARVTARLAAALSPPLSEESASEMRELAATALGMARRLGDPHTLLRVLPFTAATAGLAAPEAERFAMLQETVLLARSLDQRMVQLQALPGYVTALVARGELAQAERALASHDALLAELPQPQQQARSHLLHAMLHLVRGQFEEAERHSAEARGLAEATRSPGVMSLWMFQRFSMAYLRGRPELVTEMAEPLVLQLAAWRTTLPLAAWLSAASGRRDEALDRLTAYRPEPDNLVGLCGAADACVMLADRVRGEPLYPLLVARAKTARAFSALSPGALQGPLSRTLGDLARLTGRPAEAAQHYQQAIADCDHLGAGWLAARCRQALEGSAHAAPARPHAPRFELRREGDVWAIVPVGAPPFRLKHSKGLAYLSCLLEQPGREVHVLDLLGVEHLTGDAGPLLDPRAKAEYRSRVEDLRQQLAEAESFSDQVRASRLRAELEAIAEQLAGAVGLGGRDRLAASDVERARINVQRRLRVALDHIAAADPALGRYLEAAVRTGTTCIYQPF